MPSRSCRTRKAEWCFSARGALTSVAGLGDLDADGVPDLAVGAYQDGDGGAERGAVWILSLDGCLAAPVCCPGNADAIGGVNFADVISVLANFGAVGMPGTQSPGDANCDGVANFADITEVLRNFNAACP